MRLKWTILILAAVAALLIGSGALIPLGAQSPANSPSAAPEDLATRIQKIISRPEYAHANFGIEFYSLDSGKVIYSLNPQKMFVPGSATKIFTEGTLLAKLGPDYRFHTRIYRTGPIVSRGRLKGDLVLVASGDPNLSNRVQPDGTLSFVDNDHTYGGPAVPGDPLLVIKQLAAAVKTRGIQAIDGRVLIDPGFLGDGPTESGTGTTMSAVVVNDNVIDLVLKPGAKAGDPVVFESSPHTAYINFINNLTTTPAGTAPKLGQPNHSVAPDGTVTVPLDGSMPVGMPTITYSFAVPSPVKFAAAVFREALAAQGIKIKDLANSADPDLAEIAKNYTDENQIADHASPPFSEAIKVTLKVSQNLHANLGPYLLGSLVAKDQNDPFRAGFAVERAFLQQDAKLDLSGASQADGAGGAPADYFSPDFTCRYLTYWTTRPDYPVFFKALPILGKDGTLSDIQVQSPAAGHVFAKTGTLRGPDTLNGRPWLRGKGLAGYVFRSNGEKLAFAVFLNNVSLPTDDDAQQRIAGQALGEIAAAAYDSAPEVAYDLIIRNAHIIDGAGNPWYAADIAVQSDRIAAIGDLHAASARRDIDAHGHVVAPGFIDMLGHSELSLLLDNRSLSKLSQGITTEITGERSTVAPQTEKTLAPLKPMMDLYNFNVDWTSLDGYFARLEKQGTPLNLGTYVGSSQVRQAVIGDDNRQPTAAELEQMKAFVAEAMKQGALGLSSALVYPPNAYAKTDELIAMARVASQYGGLYATHMRSEGETETEALAEAIRIGREANLPVEIFHLKVSGKARWGNMKNVIATIQAARDSGLDIAANMYPYTAGSTALVSALPPWASDGGRQQMLARLRDPQIRARIKKELGADHKDWENLLFDSGGASGVMIASVEAPELKQFEGKRLADVAKTWKKSPEDTLMDFVLADSARSGAIYFLADEEDLKLGLRQPWTSIGLDWGESSLNGPGYEAHAHPRAFGSMPRFLGQYVRDQHLLPLETAIRKITSLPAQREHLPSRGLLAPGYFADLVMFDPATIADNGNYTTSPQLSTGIELTVVNGQIEFENGKLTGVTAGRALRGRGWQPAIPPAGTAR